MLLKMANIFDGCTAHQVRKVAYEYAESLKLPHNFNNSCMMAGRDWLEGFLKRHRISVRKPEATSVNRVTAFNKTEVSLFYKNLEKLREIYKFVPKNIYNCDETGISTPPRVESFINLPTKIPTISTRQIRKKNNILPY